MHGLTRGRYILTVGRLEPRKNHKRLFEAYARLSSGRPPLVVVGQKDFGYDGALEAIDALGIRDEVYLLQHVGEKELVQLYQNAMIFIYPSLAEGFGLPVLEAMACGIPVITSNNTSLVEAAGEAAMFVDATDISNIVYALSSLLASEATRQRLSLLGLNQVKRFRWDRTADVLRGSYLNLLSRHRFSAGPGMRAEMTRETDQTGGGGSSSLI
jgi:glycosyltransferase involved in cell wall biosynthesis